MTFVLIALGLLLMYYVCAYFYQSGLVPPKPYDPNKPAYQLGDGDTWYSKDPPAYDPSKPHYTVEVEASEEEG